VLRNSSCPVSGIPVVLLSNAKQTIEIQMKYMSKNIARYLIADLQGGRRCDDAFVA
jgi:hypothetical protein